MSRVVENLGGEKWRVITPILLTALSVLVSISIFIWSIFLGQVTKNSKNIERLFDVTHRIEVWQASTKADSFGFKDGVVLKKEIFDDTFNK